MYLPGGVRLRPDSPSAFSDGHPAENRVYFIHSSAFVPSGRRWRRAIAFACDPIRARVVSNIVQLFRNASYDDQTTSAMGAAFDKTCRALHDKGQPPLVQEIIASAIVRAAAAGERSPKKLSDIALQTLGFDERARKRG